MAIRYVFRAGTDSDWAVANPILAKGEPAWSVDSLTLKIGDGASPWTALVGITFGNQSQPAFIDDTQAQPGAAGSTTTTLSSQAILGLFVANSVADRAYADTVANQAGGPRVVPVIQNPDGTWPATTAGAQDISLWQGTVGFGAAPPAGVNDITVLRDPA